MRRAIPLTVALCWAVTACESSVHLPASSSASASKPATSKPTKALVITCTANNTCEDADPEPSGCGAASSRIAGPLPVLLPSGKQYANLYAVHSAVCQTLWAQVDGFTAAGMELHIEVERPADGKKIAPQTTGATPNTVYANTDMLSLKLGCVKVKAYVKNGPVAQSSCLKG